LSHFNLSQFTLIGGPIHVGGLNPSTTKYFGANSDFEIL